MRFTSWRPTAADFTRPIARGRGKGYAPPGGFCRLFVDSSGSVTLVAANEQSELGVTDNRSDPDGVDQNCDGVDGVDADGDGIASRPTGGSDEDE